MGLKALPSVTAPALAKPWHASAMLPSPQANAVGPKKYARKKNLSQAEKLFSPRDLIEALQLRPTNQEKKTVQPLKSFFGPSSTPKASQGITSWEVNLVNSPRELAKSTSHLG